MKRTPIVGLLLSLSLFAQAQLEPQASKPARSRRDPAERARRLAETGGYVPAPATGSSVVFLNTQQRVPAAALAGVPREIASVSTIPASLSTRQAQTPAKDAAAALADTNTAVVIVIADTAEDPPLLVAPESRWARINVAALAADKPAADVLADRTRKEMWRAFAFVMGAAHTALGPCLMQPVLRLGDLDDLKLTVISPEPLSKAMTYASLLGIKPVQMTTYRQAVEEGWAPPPENDHQKAIWKALKEKRRE